MKVNYEYIIYSSIIALSFFLGMSVQYALTDDPKDDIQILKENYSITTENLLAANSACTKSLYDCGKRYQECESLSIKTVSVVAPNMTKQCPPAGFNTSCVNKFGWKTICASGQYAKPINSTLLGTNSKRTCDCLQC